MSSYKNWMRVQEREGARVTRMMRDGDSVEVSHQKRKFRVYRIDSEYLVMEGGTRIRNPHPAILRKGKEALNRAAVREIMES